MNVAQYLVRTLRERGVGTVFVLCGNGLNAFLDACQEQSLRVVDVRNEQAASYMADLTGRMTGRLGVCAVSAGPGHTNALTGLANAMWDGGPMLLVSGASSLKTCGLDHFQELDQVAMAAPICKYAASLDDAATAPQVIEAALAAAINSRPGPVHLTLPADVAQQTAGQRPLEADVSLLDVTPAFAGRGDPTALAAAVEMLTTAERPIVLAGSGAFYARAGHALIRLAALLDVPIFTHIWDRGSIGHPIPQYVGVTNDALNGAMALWPQADLIVTIGARVDYRVGFGRPPHVAPDVRWLRMDADPAELDRVVRADVGIAADPRQVLQQIADGLEVVGAPRKSTWMAEVRAGRDQLLYHWHGLGRGDVMPMPGIRICRELQPFLDRDVTFLIDGGNIGRWAHMVLFDRHPAHWLTCGASGVVGWGIPGAVAARLARPDHPVLLVSGDGAAGFTISEIETALRFKTPYVAVVAHDAAWGIVADGQAESWRVACELGEIRFDRVAQALGARGVYIEHPTQLAPAIDEGLRLDTVTVIHVPTQQAGTGCWEERFGG